MNVIPDSSKAEIKLIDDTRHADIELRLEPGDHELERNQVKELNT